MDFINSKSAKEVLKELKTLKCMQSLAPDTLTLLANFGVRRQFRTNEYVWKAGEPGDFVAVVTQGLIEIRRYSTGDEETSMGVFGASDVIGLSAVMNRGTYPGDAKVLAPSTAVLKLYLRPLLQSKSEEAAELQVWIRERFLQHEQVLRDKIDILNAGRIDQRVFEFFMHLARRFGQYESQTRCRIPISLTRSQVGHMVNGQVETIIRLNSRWRKAELLTWTKDEIIILNLPQLEKHLQNK